MLRPRVRIIADEHLSGAPRDAVQTRLDVWLKTHVERLLGPLFVLTLAEDVTGIARGISFQLVEALGVLERQKVAEDIKSLDQPARATLRKHGVRFGAYHIYVPALLKPAPRSLAVQLWALKHGGPEHGLENLQLLAASGRTSIPVDPKMPKLLYRTVGYHVCGARAIRVDILERLADLIRPALAWRVGTSSTKPAGAYDGRAFTVTGAMTSLTGASGEDFASILRALGYRMEKRPKPVEPAAVARRWNRQRLRLHQSRGGSCRRMCRLRSSGSDERSHKSRAVPLCFPFLIILRWNLHEMRRRSRVRRLQPMRRPKPRRNLLRAPPSECRWKFASRSSCCGNACGCRA